MLNIGGNKILSTNDRLDSLEKESGEQKDMNIKIGQNTEMLMRELNHTFDGIRKQFLDSDERFKESEKKSEKRFDKLESSFEKRFDKLESSFEKRFDKLDERFNRLDSRLFLIFITILGALIAVYFK